MERELEKQANDIYNLNDELPIRVGLFKLVAPDEKSSWNYLSIVIHHIAFDGWSNDIFNNELMSYYNYYSDPSAGLKLPDLTIQYKDFALWQRDYLRGERLAKLLDYWKEKLESYETLNLLPDKPRPSQIDYKGGIYTLSSIKTHQLD